MLSCCHRDMALQMQSICVVPSTQRIYLRLWLHAERVCEAQYRQVAELAH